MINQGLTRDGLMSKFAAALITCEPELKQPLTLKLRPSNLNGEVTFQFNAKTITAWGKELEEMERLFQEEVYDRVIWKEATPAGAQVADGGHGW